MKTRELKKWAGGMMLLVALGVSSCKDDDKPYVKPPKVAITHTISGVVNDMAGEAISGAKVNAVYGDDTKSVTTNAKGEYSISGLVKTGIYQLAASKESKVETRTVMVLEENKGALHKMWNVQLATKVTPVTVTKDAETKVKSTTETTAQNAAAATAVSVTIPANAVTQTVAVTVTPVADVHAPTKIASGSQSAEQIPSIATLKCEPVGLKFKKPVTVEIENVMQTASLKNIGLFYLNNDVWEKQEQAVTVNARGNYETSIDHFSMYKFAPNVISSTANSTEDLVITNGGLVDNMQGAKPIKVSTVGYTYKSGWSFVEAPSVVLGKVGITEAVAANMLTQTITNSLQKEGVISKNGEYPVNQTLEVGTKLTINGSQKVETITYTFTFSVSSVDKTVKIIVKHYGDCQFNISTSSRDHNGGGSF